MVLIGWCGCRSAKFFFPVSVSVDNFDYPYCSSYFIPAIEDTMIVRVTAAHRVT